MGEPLTTRENAVLKLLATGRSNREIGAALGMAVGTVKCHVCAIYSALGVRNRTEAAVAYYGL